MKQNYSMMIDDNNLVSLDITPIDCCEMDGLYINRLYMPEVMRGNGHGSAALSKLCRDADIEGVTLYVHSLPYPGECYNTRERSLRKFYEFFKFVLQSNGIHKRVPNKG